MGQATLEVISYNECDDEYKLAYTDEFYGRVEFKLPTVVTGMSTTSKLLDLLVALHEHHEEHNAGDSPVCNTGVKLSA